MLMLHIGAAGIINIPQNLTSADLPQQVAWIDILNGSTDEIAFVERVIGRHVPT